MQESEDFVCPPANFRFTAFSEVQAIAEVARVFTSQLLST